MYVIYDNPVIITVMYMYVIYNIVLVTEEQIITINNY